MIDLSQFVDKEVSVTYLNGQRQMGKLKQINSSGVYFISGIVKSFRQNGSCYNHFSYDIIIIEEVKPTSKIGELEKQVAELQKEIDRLKMEEARDSIKPVRVTRSIEYKPDKYLKYCVDNGTIPSQEGFISFLHYFYYADFARPSMYQQHIEELPT